MQAIVFYKREWLTEAKTQLEMALQDDPNNAKYRSSLDKLKMSMAGGAQPQQQAPAMNNQGNYNGNAGGDNAPPQADNMANCLSSCCCAYCLTDCLCSAMRCC